MKTFEIEPLYTPTFAPWRNGRAERTVRTVKHMVKRVLLAREQEEFTVVIPRLQYAMNTCISRATGISPFELFFGEKAPPLVRLDPRSYPTFDLPDTADPEQV